MDNIRSMSDRLAKNRRTISEPDRLYREYLQKHREGVRKCFYETMLPILKEEGISNEMLYKISEIIEHHDESKYSPEEFGPYRDYFYDKEKYPRSTEAYELAWLHHQNHSPHHWQYWVLIQDEDNPRCKALDMPFEYIIELLCDWDSASKHYGNTAYEWWIKQQEHFIMTDYTYNTIAKYIEIFK